MRKKISQIRLSGIFGVKLPGIVSYSYNADGLRTSKTVQGTTTQYYWNNGVLYGEKTGSEYILFLYDESGRPYGFDITNGTTHNYFYYEFDLQGDIIGIIDRNGRKIVNYEYGPWGEVISIAGNQTIALKNPLRYRGYYFDNETGFYYLNSRYYDPEIGRFLNADGYVSTGQGIVGNNMFAYCNNNPVNYLDQNGEFALAIALASVAINVVSTIIATAVTGQKFTWMDFAVATGTGLLNGFTYGWAIGALVSGVYTGYSCYQNGTSFGTAFLCGVLSGVGTVCSIGNLASFQGSTIDFVTTVVTDAVFGTGYNCISTATTKAAIDSSGHNIRKSPTTSTITIVKTKRKNANTRIVNGKVISLDKKSSYVHWDNNRIYCDVPIM